jgi:hypothetical protein
MRSSVRRVGLGGLSLFGGILAVSVAFAAEVPEDALKAVLESDVQRVNDLVAKYTAAPDKKAPIQIRSTAMMVAAYAQSKMTTDKGKAKEWAGLRDQALKVYETALPGKDVKKATPLDLAKMGEGKTESVKLHSAVKFDIYDLMAQFKKTEALGLNLEKDIKDGATKGAKVDATGIAVRTAFVAEFLKEVGPDGGFPGGKQTKKEWDGPNEKMMAATKELLEAGGSAAKVQAALKKLDGACTSCHNVFK